MDRILEELLIEDSGITKTTEEIADVILKEIEDSVNSGKLYFHNEYLDGAKQFGVPVAIINGQMKMSGYEDEDSKFLPDFAKINYYIYVYDISSLEFKNDFEEREFLKKYIESLYQYSSQNNAIYGKVAVRKKTSRFEIVSRRDVFAHEVQHAFQSGLNGLKQQKLHINCDKNRTFIFDNSNLNNIKYGLYYLSNPEITAKVNQLYYDIKRNKLNTPEDVYNKSIVFKEIKETLNEILKSLDLVSKDKNLIKTIEKILNTKFSTIEKYIKRGNNILLTKIHKAIYYWIRESDETVLESYRGCEHLEHREGERLRVFRLF